MSSNTLLFNQRTDSGWVRRQIDMIIAMLGLLILSPLWLMIAVCLVIDSPGPLFYPAKRVGKDGKIFHLYKFRSMVVNADRHGPAITAAGDARVTRVGRILRKTKLDELPQLLNVLRGEMSLVGPRPEDPRYVAIYTAEQRQILRVAPGITSAASLAFRHEEQLLAGGDWETVYRTQVLPSKLAIDLEYLAHRTLLSDLFLILRTIFAMAR